jgi:hypothetical protein
VRDWGAHAAGVRFAAARREFFSKEEKSASRRLRHASRVRSPFSDRVKLQETFRLTAVDQFATPLTAARADVDRVIGGVNDLLYRSVKTLDYYLGGRERITWSSRRKDKTNSTARRASPLPGSPVGEAASFPFFIWDANSVPYRMFRNRVS